MKCLILAILLTVLFASVAWAGCYTHTIFTPRGSITCTTCCWGTYNCTTTCF
jgi:hypothetical protein